MPRSTSQRKSISPTLVWDKGTELIGLNLSVQPHQDMVVPSHYTTELHSWFLDQVRRTNFKLSSHLHDEQSEKPFTISCLDGLVDSQGRSLRFAADRLYTWTITALTQPVVEWMRQWLLSPPTDIHLRSGSLRIVGWEFAHPPTTYDGLLQIPPPQSPTITLSFLTPTSFRRKGNHLPLPLPTNLFQSYLRRWNNFSQEEVDQDEFLDWIDECVIILRHQIQSAKVMAGKSGAVTGFTGSVQLGLASKADRDPELVELWLALGQLAPYCGTGHKTTFGLGQTRLGWLAELTPNSLSLQDLLAQRIAELTEQFIAQRKRTGGDRATQVAETWATILARREMGESLQAIAADLEMPYETVKTYAKLARRMAKS
ncbi:CRISPR-associated endoribonuclease Cas6 (plasmid) [Kovacikia minuta CCNUW1]|uniref:CRISPR-associated endoribonuclease Cas6 n=1 Tax=Kovacikia minuta TaxID=2931930 RepID=UPI001CCB524B|nr:CRISPR-associated endoribonuclease Cas6 [Kovacikia minuta]UBF30374.1 CRISPR-associated endoribonuclease Cas6 [Kovacikia minuta CCNUW1]